MLIKVDLSLTFLQPLTLKPSQQMNSGKKQQIDLLLVLGVRGGKMHLLKLEIISQKLRSKLLKLKKILKISDLTQDSSNMHDTFISKLQMLI